MPKIHLPGDNGHLHDVIFDLDEELLHGEDVVRHIERAHGHEESGVVQADQLPQHGAAELGLQRH